MSSASSPAEPQQPDPAANDELDPVFLHARREAVVIFCVWLVGLFWAVPFCYFSGYLNPARSFDPDQLATVWGIPAWLFWGIFVPWIAADVFTTWFCFCFMKEDDLGGQSEDSATADQADDEDQADDRQANVSDDKEVGA